MYRAVRVLLLGKENLVDQYQGIPIDTKVYQSVTPQILIVIEAYLSLRPGVVGGGIFKVLGCIVGTPTYQYVPYRTELSISVRIGVQNTGYD
ncbi:hypothetical protein BHM03_00002973 [Ensete ventricosum]|nr:hypothetical protein BHM03_00002973 [Ensete ventricosum]